MSEYEKERDPKPEARECEHKRAKIWEPHLAGARKCLDCGMVYNPNRGADWYIEQPSLQERYDAVAKELDELEGMLEALNAERDHLRAENARMREALEYQLTALRKICEGSMFTPESERAAAEKIIKAALAGDGMGNVR